MRFLPIYTTVLCTITVLGACTKSSNEAVTSQPDTAATETIESVETTRSTVGPPTELIAFVPEGYAILDTASGDLNLDGTTDVLLVLKDKNEETVSDGTEFSRPLLILTRDTDGKLTRARENGFTVMCRQCGGVFGDPYVGLTIKNGYFSVEHYGGSNWRWTKIITYKYSKEDNEWYLHKVGGESYHTSDPDKSESHVRTTKDFGKVKFEEYSYNEEDE